MRLSIHFVAARDALAMEGEAPAEPHSDGSPGGSPSIVGHGLSRVMKHLSKPPRSADRSLLTTRQRLSLSGRLDYAGSMSIDARLADLGIKLPTPPAAAGSYVPTVRSGRMLYCAGTIASLNGEMTHTGQVGREQTVETGYDAARVCALNTLANIKAAMGSLDAVGRIVFVSGFVNAVSGFADSPAVINGASDLFVEVFGEPGRHARAAVAVAGLPRNSTTEVLVVAELKE
jgi:enamine deaminase RidA (YjgF/YER057c/UK114 family)